MRLHSVTYLAVTNIGTVVVNKKLTLHFCFYNRWTIRSRAKNDRQNDTGTKATIVSVVGKKQNFKRCAQKVSSQVDGWLSLVVCWPAVPAQELVDRVSHNFFHTWRSLDYSENPWADLEGGLLGLQPPQTISTATMHCLRYSANTLVLTICGLYAHLHYEY